MSASLEDRALLAAYTEGMKAGMQLAMRRLCNGCARGLALQQHGRGWWHVGPGNKRHGMACRVAVLHEHMKQTVVPSRLVHG
jgi:hypothetical protein